MEANITGTKVLRALNESERWPIWVLEGSSRSSKTISILQNLILRCLRQPGFVVRSFRHDQVTCRKTLVPDFLWIMRTQLRPLFEAGTWNKSECVYTYPNGSQHFFDGCSDLEKLHGFSQDVAHYNEVMEIGYDAQCQIAMRTRVAQIMDFNPSLNHHWVFDRILSRDDVFYLHSTYKDNPFLTPVQIAEIEKFRDTPANRQRGTVDRWKWEVYGEGKRGRREGNIFENWRIVDEWPAKINCRRHGYGMDFGFSLDPSTLIECCVFQDQLWLRERIWEPGLFAFMSESQPGLASIEGRLRELEINQSSKIYADCEDPRIISGLAATGWNAIPCEKGPGSVLAGIDLLKSWQINVHRSSQNLQREFEQYSWHKDRKTGAITSEPEQDGNDHGIDAVRYWAITELKPQWGCRQERSPYPESDPEPVTYL